MDAATPLRRWLLSAAFITAVALGCQYNRGTDGQPGSFSLADDPPDPHQEEVARQQRQGRQIDEQKSRNKADYRSNDGASRPAAVRPQMPVDPKGGAVPASYSPSVKQDKPLQELQGDPRVKVVAVVGAGNIVTDQEVWEATRQRMSEYVSLVDGPGGKQIIRDDEKEKKVYREELRQIIDRELILDEMYTRLKKVGKGHIIDEIKSFASKAADRQIRTFKKLYKAESDEDFISILTSQGLTLPVIRRQIERHLMSEEYVRNMLKEKGKSVGLHEVRDYYDANPKEFQTADRVKWLDIFISFNRYATPREAYDHAVAVHQQAAGGADFVELSKKYDQGLAGQQKGEGIGQKRGEILPPEVEPAVWSLQPGQVSGLIQTPVGYHIVKVAERDYAGIRPFDDKTQAEIRTKLLKQLQDREYKKLVEDLWRRSVVRVIETP